ncbi:MAG: DUF1592 domain-containing protein [Planctomycetaceae bacterium]|nr:DUF1592 domain-containing protein [Planctomycetaceae bacterium]
MRKLFALFVALSQLSLLAATVATAAPATFAPQAEALFAKYCVECHNAQTAERDLNLPKLAPQFDDPGTLDTWVRIYQRIHDGKMPPADSPQPSAVERQQLLDPLGRELRSVMRERQTREGRVELRRLNRIEYQNTIHDLLGIETNVMELLPEDALAFGFDKIDTALTLSPVQMEKYLEAADVALDAALGVGPAPKYVQEKYPATALLANWDSKSTRQLEGSDSIIMFNSGYSPTELRKFRAPAPGRYHIRMQAQAVQSDGKPGTLRVYAGNFGVGGKTKLLGHYAAGVEPTVIEFDARIDGRGDTLKIVPYGTIPWQNQGATYEGPGVKLDWIEVDGPLDAKQWPPATRAKLIGDVDLNQGSGEDAATILKRFARRAFRRPISDEELTPYLQLVRERLAQGVAFGDALRVGIKAVLVSPRFLLLDEQPGQLDPYALASRLSYFLWSTMPDEELLAAAAKGELNDSQKLAAQVERMLQHERAHGFTENFTGQWLGLRNIEFTTPDMRLYPEFDEFLQVSMVRETHAFFDEILRHDLSLVNFVDSDFAMLNERLAKQYGIPGVTGLEIRKVPLKPEWHRGGVMTLGSVLKVTANGTTTSPIVRGFWIADRLLGQAVPLPAANVPAVEPDIRGAKTIREQLAKHREVTTCASCHAQIDPLGFALENYDVIGGWRERYRISPERGQRADYETLVVNQRDVRIALGPPVDASDTLPDGRRFDNLAGLKQFLTANPEPVARGLTEKLLIYSTGHGLVFTDAAVVDDIVKQVQAKQYGFRSLVHAVVQSDVFRRK